MWLFSAHNQIGILVYYLCVLFVFVGEEMKCHARFMSAVACSDVPKVTVITGAFQGLNAYAMVSYRHKHRRSLFKDLIHKRHSFHLSSKHWFDNKLLSASLLEEVVDTTYQNEFCFFEIWIYFSILTEKWRCVQLLMSCTCISTFSYFFNAG